VACRRRFAPLSPIPRERRDGAEREIVLAAASVERPGDLDHRENVRTIICGARRRISLGEGRVVSETGDGTGVGFERVRIPPPGA